MRRKLEERLFGKRRRMDAAAWESWQYVESLRPRELPPVVGSMLMAGRVSRIYQNARGGTKALVDFGAPLGVQDTWWEQMRPPLNVWVVVEAHLWLPPGTHSEQHVLWVDRWDSTLSSSQLKRALRHNVRLGKLERAQAQAS
jgi:hypothetical protein